MNRPIKFRVWHKKSKEWCGTIGLNESISQNELEYDTDDLVFVQYTGLTDKNKNLIYEGDIVKFSRLFEKERKIKELKSFVRFHNGQFGFDLIGFNDMFFTLSDECGIEVIGNIFEHPELLN
jgi:uncharacterized phage protein (TIGR01671 family)